MIDRHECSGIFCETADDKEWDGGAGSSEPSKGLRCALMCGWKENVYGIY